MFSAAIGAEGGGDGFDVRATDFGYSRLTDFWRPYLMQLEVVDTTEGVAEEPVVQVTASLYDETGTNEIFRIFFTDRVHAPINGIPVYESGPCGVMSNIQWDNVNMDAKFDDIRAVPEPSTLVLLSTAGLGLIALAVRRRRRPSA